ncbi:MAG TPA: hypothetical protein VGE51_00805 [Fontimonas sp.]
MDLADHRLHLRVVAVADGNDSHALELQTPDDRLGLNLVARQPTKVVHKEHLELAPCSRGEHRLVSRPAVVGTAHRLVGERRDDVPILRQDARAAIAKLIVNAGRALLIRAVSAIDGGTEAGDEDGIHGLLPFGTLKSYLASKIGTMQALFVAFWLLSDEPRAGPFEGAPTHRRGAANAILPRPNRHAL